ncbi:MAG: peptide-binding protein [Leptospirales bacterium]
MQLNLSLYRKLTVLVLIGIIGISASFCSPSVLTKKDPYTLRTLISTNPKNFNPVLLRDAYSSQIAGRIYESMLERDYATLKLKASLARKWEISQDKKTIKFYLRKDVKFHDGTPFTAQDVVFTFNKVMDKTVPNPHMKVYFADVETLYATDDYTIVIRMKKPYFMILEHIGSMSIIPKHIFSKVEDFVVNEYNTRKPIGTGPYKFKTWVSSQKVTLVRNENYWGKKPEIRTIEYKIIEKVDVALQALKKRDLDYMSVTPFQWQRQLTSDRFKHNFNRYKYLSAGYRYIGYNTRKFPFNDKRVRVAMAYLTNREKIRQTILEGLAVTTTGNFWLNSPQYNKKLVSRPYDPEKAKALLSEAGFIDADGDGILDKDGKPFKFELLVPSGNKFYERFVPVFKEDMKMAGIEVEIRQIQFQALIEKINERNFEALMLGWSMGVEGDPYQLWHSSQVKNGDNFTGFTTPEMDEIIVNARTEFNAAKRNRMYQRFHEILYEEQPYTFLYTSYSLVVLDKRFTNVIEHPIGLNLMEWKINIKQE